MIKTQEGDLVTSSAIVNGTEIQEEIREAERRLLETGLRELGYEIKYLGHEITPAESTPWGDTQYMSSYARLVKIK